MNKEDEEFGKTTVAGKAGVQTVEIGTGKCGISHPLIPRNKQPEIHT